MAIYDSLATDIKKARDSDYGYEQKDESNFLDQLVEYLKQSKEQKQPALNRTI